MACNKPINQNQHNKNTYTFFILRLWSGRRMPKANTYIWREKNVYSKTVTASIYSFCVKLISKLSPIDRMFVARPYELSGTDIPSILQFQPELFLLCRCAIWFRQYVSGSTPVQQNDDKQLYSCILPTKTKGISVLRKQH